MASILRVKDKNGNIIDIPAIKGDKGDSYVLTEVDKMLIKDAVIAEIDIPESGGIPVVHELPTDAQDGDICLYSPANTIELCDSGKRIYFDWEEFAKPVGDDEATLLEAYSGANYEEKWTFLISGYRLNSNEIGFSIEYRPSAESEDYTYFTVQLDTSRLVEAYLSVAENGEEIITEYSSIDEIPKYFDLPKFENLTVNEKTGNAFLFYAPYRLMVYRGGEWQSIETLLDIEDGSVDLSDYYTKQEIDDKAFVTEENLPKGGVYVGSGDMPDNCNVQIDPTGDTITVPTRTSELKNDSGFINDLTEVWNAINELSGEVMEIEAIIDESGVLE